MTLTLFNQSISHAKTSLLDDVAGGSQGVQLLDSLTDQIRAKYEQLDSGKFGSSGTPDIHRFSNRKWVITMCSVGNL